jgi:hypothetical protein
MNEVLRGIVERHGTMLVDDARRCEACIREAALARPEAASLVAALRDGIPKQLLRLPAGTLARSEMTRLAAQLAENGGIDDALAQRAVEAWAHALRLSPAAKPGQAKPGQAKPEQAKPEQSEPRKIATEPPTPPRAPPKAVPRQPAQGGRRLQQAGDAVGRGMLVLGIVGLVVLMLIVGGLAIGQLIGPTPSSCGDFSGPSSLLPSRCHRNPAIYLVGFVLLAGGVGALWRKLRR